MLTRDAELTIAAWALLVAIVSAVAAGIAVAVSIFQAAQAKRSANAAERSACASETSAEHSKKWADIEARKQRAEQAYLCLEDLHGFKDVMLRITRRYHSSRGTIGANPGNHTLDQWIEEAAQEREEWFRWYDRSRIWFDDSTVLAIERVTHRATEIIQAMRDHPPGISVKPYGDIPHKRDFSNAVINARDSLKGHLLG